MRDRQEPAEEAWTRSSLAHSDMQPTKLIINSYSLAAAAAAVRYLSHFGSSVNA